MIIIRDLFGVNKAIVAARCSIHLHELLEINNLDCTWSVRLESVLKQQKFGRAAVELDLLKL